MFHLLLLTADGPPIAAPGSFLEVEEEEEDEQEEEEEEEINADETVPVNGEALRSVFLP